MEQFGRWRKIMVSILYTSVRHLWNCSWSATPAWSSQKQDKLKQKFPSFSEHQRCLWSWLSHRLSLLRFLISEVFGEKGWEFKFLMSIWSEVKSLSRVRLFATPWSTCSLPGSLVHGIFQAIVLEWIAISFSRGSSQSRDWTRVSRIVDRRLTVWATRGAGKCVSYRTQVPILKAGTIFPWRACGQAVTLMHIQSQGCVILIGC